MKTCTKCSTPKDEAEFYTDKRTPDGLKYWCKDCHKADSKKRESNYNEYRRKYRAEHKEESRTKKKEYYENNKQTILSGNSKWRRTVNGRFLSYLRGAKKEMLNGE